MIIEYSRPDTINDALMLLNRQTPRSIPLGGGTSISQTRSDEAFAVVDLQSLGMREMVSKNEYLEVGANVTLQQLHDCDLIPAAMRTSLGMEGNFNLRQMATIGGTIASSDGGSGFLAILQAVEAKILWEPGKKLISIEDFLQDFQTKIPGFISGMRFPLSVISSLQSVSRTPLSESIMCVCGARNLGGVARIMITDPSSPSAVKLFEGSLEPGSPNSKEIATYWSKHQPTWDPYSEAILIELIERVLADLRKEG